jgi:hypothetical protein
VNKDFKAAIPRREPTKDSFKHLNASEELHLRKDSAKVKHNFIKSLVHQSIVLTQVSEPHCHYFKDVVAVPSGLRY